MYQDQHGQPGLDPRDCRDKAIPQIVSKIQGMYIRQMAAGLNHSVLIVSPNATAKEIDVLTWGRGTYGQLGHGSGEKVISGDALIDLRKMIGSFVFSTNQNQTPPSSHLTSAHRLALLTLSPFQSLIAELGQCWLTC